jgi:isoleucyl-tRNA synthetase
LIYRGEYLVNWCPASGSAVSDLEVEMKEVDGHLWHFRYPLTAGAAADGRTHLEVATTRPETLLGDVAVMVHPEDERYAHLIGKEVQLPLCNRTIPVIADDYVDREFGTGVVKVTPAHDVNDYAVGQRHQLPIIGVLNLDATINHNAPEKYRGLDRFVARYASPAFDLRRAPTGDLVGALHSLRGAAGNVGAMRLYDETGRLEEALRAGGEAALPSDGLASITATLEETLSAMRAHLAA